jgi:hypothetical protein
MLTRPSSSPSSKTTPAAPKSWRDVLPIHPAANKIPVATTEERRVLNGDLQKHGQRVPVVLVRVAGGVPQLLDGRHRLDLQEGAGVPVIDTAGNMLVPHQIVEVADDKEAELLSLSLNAHRRHLKPEQKRELIKAYLKANPEKSDRQIAAEANASPSTVGKERAKREPTVQLGQLPKRVGKDGKARKLPAKKSAAKETKPPPAAPIAKPAAVPGAEARSNGGNPQEEADKRKEAYAGDYPDIPPCLLRTNPISAAWQAATAEQRRQFADEHGAAVVELMGGAGHARAA